MKSSILIFFIFLSLKGVGQTQYLGLQGGFTQSNVSGKLFLENNGDRKAWSGGLTYQLQFDNNFTLGSGISFFQKGFYNDIVDSDEMGNPQEPLGGRSYFNYHYLSVPLTAGYRVGKKIGGFMSLGMVPSILIHANVRNSGIEGIIDPQKILVTDRVSKFDFGVIGELGILYKLSSSMLISTAFCYQQSIISITNENYFPGKKVRHYGTTLSIGVQYKLNKKQ